jgi:type VI secretion system VasD/TssJ family lipoprotein
MDRDRSVLGTKVRAEEIVVRPGETRKSRQRQARVRFVGVAVLFQDIDRSQWRAVAGIAPSGVTTLVLVLGSNRATLEAA